MKGHRTVLGASMHGSYFLLSLVCSMFLSFAVETFLANRVTFVGGISLGFGGTTRLPHMVTEPLTSPKAIALPPNCQIYQPRKNKLNTVCLD